MFEFITISNGVAVVQHASSGHVYRFRPAFPNQWGTLVSHRVDTVVPTGSTFESIAEEARGFAEACASAAWIAPSEIHTAGEPARGGLGWIFGSAAKRARS